MKNRHPGVGRCVGALLAALLLWAASSSMALAQDAAALRARHASLQQRLASNQFQRPLVLESAQAANDLKGDVYAVVDQPFSVVAPALQGMERWCDLLILHLNVKHCAFAGKAPNEVLSLSVGRKFDQPLDDAYRVDFTSEYHP